MGAFENEDWRGSGKTLGALSNPLPCRHEPTQALVAKGVKFFGASIVKVTDEALAKVNADLVINLTGMSLSKFRRKSKDCVIKSGPKWFNRFFPRKRVEEIVIDWPDMGIIPVGPQFFETIWKAIQQQNKKSIVVFCVGGHGRTGTFLGCMMTVIEGIHGGQAIRHIRQVHCEKAIETKGQENMVRRMTRRPIERKAGEQLKK